MENYFLELPIYSMSREKYEEKLKEKMDKEKLTIQTSKNDPNYELIMETYKNIWYRTWDYNQIIGYVRFYKEKNVIYGEIWMINKKRIPLKLDCKYFKYEESNPEWGYKLGECKTSRDVFELFCKIIPNDSTEFLKKYYIDLDYFKRFGKYVDWKNYLNIDEDTYFH